LGRINSIRGKIQITEVENTRLLNIIVTDTDPTRARDIANTLPVAYIEFNTASRTEHSQNTLSWMTDQLYELQRKLEDAEAEFLAYKQKEKLFSVQGKQDIISNKINEFNSTYLETRNKRLELDAKLAELERLRNDSGQKDIIHIRSLIENSVIDHLYTQLIEADVERSRLSKIYKSRHPKLVQVRTQIANTRYKLTSEIKKELDNMKAQRSVLAAREEVLLKPLMISKMKRWIPIKKSLSIQCFKGMSKQTAIFTIPCCLN
jgi:succinoglycan biosynthesis transport protein ExoP